MPVDYPTASIRLSDPEQDAYDGNLVVSADHVVAIRAQVGGGCVIYLTGGQFFTVKERPQEVSASLNWYLCN